MVWRCGKSGMILQLMKDEQNTVTNALRHGYWSSELIRRIEEPDHNIRFGQLDEIQGALAQEALAAGTKVHALLQRLECMGR